MAQEIRNEICWDILQSATSSHKLLVIHAYLSVCSEMLLAGRHVSHAWIALQGLWI